MRNLAALALASLLPLSAFAQPKESAPTAPADAEAPRAAQPSAHLAAAQRLYQKLDLDAALAELQLAEAGRTSEDEMVQVLIYRGLIYSETGKAADASDQFKRALAMRPWAEVPPETSPRIAKKFSEARKSVWGMASVKPPKRRAARAQTAPTTSAPTVPGPAMPASAAPASTAAASGMPEQTPAAGQNAAPASATQAEPQKAEPAVAK